PQPQRVGEGNGHVAFAYLQVHQVHQDRVLCHLRPTVAMKPLHVATLRFLGRNLNDLARARWERNIEADPAGMSYVVLTASEFVLRDVHYFDAEGARTVIEWRDAYLADQREKAAEALAASALRLDGTK